MEKKENQRISLTKRLLQEGLLRILEAKTLEKISVTELCREAGINRATFYNHYGSPKDLLADIENRITHELEDMLGTPQTLDELSDQLEAVCTYLKEHAHLVGVLFKCHADQDLADAFNNLNKHLQRKKGGNTSIPGLDAESTHLVATFFYTGCYHMIREWLIWDIQKTPKEIAQLLLGIISKEYL